MPGGADTITGDTAADEAAVMEDLDVMESCRVDAKEDLVEGACRRNTSGGGVSGLRRVLRVSGVRAI